MKKIINGKVYDTETAQLIAEAHHDNIRDAYGTTTKQWLYRKRTGEFFLCIEGTSVTLRNIRQTGFQPSRGIYPLTFEEAQKWAEAELSAEKWIEIFGDPEDEDKTRVNVWITSAANAKLRAAASRAGKSVGDVIEELINGNL